MCSAMQALMAVEELRSSWSFEGNNRLWNSDRFKQLPCHNIKHYVRLGHQ